MESSNAGLFVGGTAYGAKRNTGSLQALWPAALTAAMRNQYFFPLVIELKSQFDGDTAVAARATDILATYDGPAALMSFDPDLVAAVRHLAPRLPRGITMEHRYDDPEWDMLPPARKFAWGNLLHFPRTRPDFLAHYVKELPSAPVSLARRAFRLPVLTWTVRTPEDRALAARHADQMIFEGFLP